MKLHIKILMCIFTLFCVSEDAFSATKSEQLGEYRQEELAEGGKTEPSEILLTNDDPSSIRHRESLRLAREGNKKSMIAVAYNYANGDGANINHGKAAFWYDKLFKLGHKDIKSDLEYEKAMCYAHPKKADNDKVQHNDWLSKKLASIFKEKQNNEELFFEKNDKHATYLFDNSARLGHAKAQYELAKRYTNGVGTEKNDENAFYWFHQAALKGHKEAQRKLGYCYSEGIGVSSNQKKATYWLSRSNIAEKNKTEVTPPSEEKDTSNFKFLTSILFIAFVCVAIIYYVSHSKRYSSSLVKELSTLPSKARDLWKSLYDVNNAVIGAGGVFILFLIFLLISVTRETDDLKHSPETSPSSPKTSIEHDPDYISGRRKLREGRGTDITEKEGQRMFESYVSWCDKCNKLKRECIHAD